MRSKRLLSLLMAVCLVFSVMSPVAASAVQPGNDVVAQTTNQTAGKAEAAPSDLIVSSDEANDLRTLRDEQNSANKGEFSLAGTVNQEGGWTANKIEMPGSMLEREVPDCVRELRELAKTHSAADVVSAFVVLEKAPLVHTYSSINDVPADAEAGLVAQQNAVISQIENNVLAGEKLTVVDQFTYLTNAIVVETEFSNLESIALLEGVETVFITPVFYPCTTLNPQTVTSGQMSGVGTVWENENLGYSGQGMTIAILDTGLDLDHPSFAADPEGASWSSEDVAGMLADLDLNAEILFAESMGSELTADALYYNAKVPFAFNYAMGSTNVGHNDGVGDHGTHVAGIAAANEVEGTGVVGMAPNAQIIVMKVFSPEGGANMYDILNALEDCMKLGVDVANMSLGSPAGFTTSGIEVIDDIFAAINTTDLIVDIAAGNEGTASYGSMWGNYSHLTEDIDNATISSPSTYANSLSIASVDNAYVMGNYVALADGTKVFYQPSVEYLYGETTNGLIEVLGGETLDYVIVPNLGAAEDFLDADGNSIVEGKVAVVKRGEISFSEKAFNAEAAGAVAVIIWDNVAEDIFSFGMTTASQDEEGNSLIPGVPVILLSMDDGQKLADAETAQFTVSEEDALRTDPNGGQMSSFSCWGVAPDLSLLPDFAGVGGNIYSCYDNGQYGLMSGTSMATPQVAGITALVLQYIEDKFPNLNTAEKRALVDALMMSTAVPVIDNDTGLEASPRQQGAGLVNALSAVTTGAYLSVKDSDRPKAELGASENGTFEFTFTIHNFSDKTQSYLVTPSLLCEDYMEDENFPGKYFLAEQEHKLDEKSVDFYAHSGSGTLTDMGSGMWVNVSAGETRTYTVKIALSAADKEWIDTYFPSGNYVEGFIRLQGNNDYTVDLSLPFLGFYGDWAEARMFDTGFWYENGFWADMMPVADNGIDANEYYHVAWMSTGSSEADWVLGMNIYAENLTDENGNIRYDSKNNVVSPNGDGVMDQITDFYLSLMRNAKYLNLTYTDAEGNVVDVVELDHISKTMYNSNYGGTVPFVYSWYYDGLYDFTDADGNYLPDGTALTLTISAAPDGCGDEMTDEIVIPVYVDTVAPQLVGEVQEVSNEYGNFIVLTFQDEHPAFAAVMNRSGTQIYVEMDDTYFQDNGDGTYSAAIPVTGLGDNFVVALCDYGANEEYYELTWSETGTNNPEVSADTLYAYQVYDELIGNNYGPDYMYGWTEMDKETAVATLVSSDANEYYAINAAEYAGGYVFAVDAGGNLVYMIPGLWNRTHISSLGINAIEMAFDEVTQTMYVTGKTESDYGYIYGLYTVDLLTGDLELVHEYDSQYAMPWAMTFVDGELYCCKYYYSGFFQVDLEGETYELVQVTDADGNDFMPTNMGGTNVRPVYAQSMTYSPADGVIYWAYYSGSACELLTIDPENWTSSAVAMRYDQEFVGLLTVEDDGYTLPEATAITKLELSEESVILASDVEYPLTATTLPWNAPAPVLTWTSDNESVATVNAEGVVTTVGEGMATITVSFGELSDSCTINVVDIAGDFIAYNYYSGNGYGDWINVDMTDMSITSMFASPVDFIAADYNGHTNVIYGFDEFGQFYAFDMATGDCAALGAPSGLVIRDMAYDYSTGLMYAIAYDMNTWVTTLYNVDMNSGALVEVAQAADLYATLACDMYGQLYAFNVFGVLNLLFVTDGEMGGGIGGWEPLSTEGESTKIIEAMPVIQAPVSEMSYIQSMCYDHTNDVILWTSPETSSVYWVSLLGEEPYIVNLGDPTESGVIEWTGMFTIPAEIPELPFVPVESIEGEDMMVLVGGAKTPAVSVYPLNATNGNVTFASADETVAKVENGMIVGVAAGTTTVTATLVDTDEDGNEKTYTCTFQVAVKESTESIYGYLVQDVYTYNGYTWINIPDTDPNNYAQLGYVEYNGAYMTLYSAEYVDGLIYAYGFDDSDWSANFQFLTIDPETWSVTGGKDMGDEFPFVYDLAFDYTTGTMYAVAGTQTATDIYMVNMDSGELIECVLTEPMFMSLAIDENGTIYAMANSQGERDPMTWETVYSNAKLYTVDVESGTYEEFMDTGVINNMLCSMAYDFDTGYIYWSSFGQTTSYIGGLYLIDPADKSCNNLGTIGPGGSQVTGLISMADAYPEIPETLQGLAITVGVAELAVGGTYELKTFQRPANLDVDMTWTVADESIATVDENGVLTGVAAGTTTVTVSAMSGDQELSATASVVVYGLDDYFLTYNRTDMGFASINRPDSTNVQNLTEAENMAEVTAMEMGPDGVLYAFDVEGKLFMTCQQSEFERNYIGHSGIEVREPQTEVDGYTTYNYTYFHAITDMAWDAANERMLAVGYEGRYTHYIYEGPYNTNEDTYMEELAGSCKIYTVDLETGALTELCVVGGETPESSVYMLAVTDTGAAYVYSAYADYVMSVDLETGNVTSHSTLQNLGVYGSAEGDPMAMTYDANTNSIYMLFTQNGNLYSLYKFNVATTALSSVGQIGDGSDIYAGLTLNEKHDFDVTLDPNCSKPGYHKLVCDCGVVNFVECSDEDGDGLCDVCGKDPEKAEAIRLAGDGRWQTALKVADEMKAALGAEKFDAIIIASGNDFADALAGSYLATVKNAPILLSYGGTNENYAYLDTDNINYIKENLAEDGVVYILGGKNAVPELYEDGLDGITVKRLGGANRFETNILILEEAGIPAGSEILVCTATNYADSLSASAVGKPILLVWNDRGILYGDQPKFLESLEDCSFTVIGGENAVSEKLADEIGKYGDVERLAGANRLETSVLVAEKYFDAPETAVLAYAWNYPDGLCGGSLAYALKAPLILTMANYEDAAIAYAAENGIWGGYILGGVGLVSDDIVRDIFAMFDYEEVVVK